jgi:hypothetical protein
MFSAKSFNSLAGRQRSYGAVEKFSEMAWKPAETGTEVRGSCRLRGAAPDPGADGSASGTIEKSAPRRRLAYSRSKYGAS